MEELVKTKKICTKCSEEKELSEFGKRKVAKDGLRSSCKSCENKDRIAYYYKKQDIDRINKEIYNKEHKLEIEEAKRIEFIKFEEIKSNLTHKVCNTCGENKKIIEFSVNKNLKLGYSNKCKSCNNEYSSTMYKNRTEENREYRKNNRDKILKRKRKYYSDNKEAISVKEKTNRLNNHDEYLEKQRNRFEKIKNSAKIYKIEKTCSNCKNTLPIESFNKSSTSLDGHNCICRECATLKIKKWRETNPKYEINRRNTDIIYRLKCNVRHRINSYMKSSGLKKNTRSFGMIGCSVDFLKRHIEELFVDDMSWDNYGINGWHIDHIIPLSSGKTDEEILKLCHYSNLQPLWWRENLQKGNKMLIR